MRVLPTLVMITCLYTLYHLPLSAQGTLRTSVLSNGATQSSSDKLSIQATIGQPLIGVSTSTSSNANHGVWFIQPSEKANPSGSTLNASTTINYSISPNPISSSAQLRFAPNCRTNLKAELYALNGKFIRAESIEANASTNGSTNEQAPLLTIDATNLATGVYSLRIHSDCDDVNIPLIISK